MLLFFQGEYEGVKSIKIIDFSAKNSKFVQSCSDFRGLSIGLLKLKCGKLRMLEEQLALGSISDEPRAAVPLRDNC